MQTELQSTSGTPNEAAEPKHFSFRPDRVEVGFPRMDLRIARMAVREEVARGVRKGPSDLLVLSDLVYESWLDDEAVKWLTERQQERRG